MVRNKNKISGYIKVRKFPSQKGFCSTELVICSGINLKKRTLDKIPYKVDNSDIPH
jgi:hypothetical protein